MKLLFDQGLTLQYDYKQFGYKYKIYWNLWITFRRIHNTTIHFGMVNLQKTVVEGVFIENIL